MLQFGIKNYEEFKELFVRECIREGKEVREKKNKVLLATWLNVASKDFRCITSETGLYSEVLSRLLNPVSKDIILEMGTFQSSMYRTDEWKGVCEDGDLEKIRYVRKDTGKVFKMKPGKFFRHILEDQGVARILPEQAKVLMCETFANAWRTYRLQVSDINLHINGDFERIYSSCYTGSTGSCMSDEGHWVFFRDAMHAKAAYITKGDDDSILARCVLYTNVYDDEGEHYVLAERPYAKEDKWRNVLIQKLIAGKHIDGYKKLSASCHDADAFESVTGEDWSGKEFYTRVDLEYDDIISYQDTFKWYNSSERTAANFSGFNHNYTLDRTDKYLDYDEGEWSDYHVYNVAEEDAVWSDIYGTYLDKSRDDVIYDPDLEDWIVDDGNSNEFWLYSHQMGRRYLPQYVEWVDELEDYLPTNIVEWSSRYCEYIPKNAEDFQGFCWSEYLQETLKERECTYSELLQDYFPDDMEEEMMSLEDGKMVAS